MHRRSAVCYQARPLRDRVQSDDISALTTAESFLTYMRKRHSVRDCSQRPVPKAVITTCIAAAGTGPLGPNHQP